MLSCWDPRDKVYAWSSQGLSSNLDLHQRKEKPYQPSIYVIQAKEKM